MKYILTDENGYLMGISESPFTKGLPEPVEIPGDLDTDIQGCYRYIDGEFILDHEKLDRYLADVARVELHNRRAQLATTRLQEIQAQTIAQSAGAAADDVIALAPLLPEWTPKAYGVGDVVQYGGEPYRCAQAHDAAGNPGRNPADAADLWAAYHATSEKYARPWRQPTGGGDIYRTGERMVYNGVTYECLQGTAYSPEEHPEAWLDRR